jgi:TraY domain
MRRRMTMNAGKPGRPMKAPTEGERVMIGVRVTPEMKNRLMEAAEKSGRSLSQEAEIRLQQSLDVEAQVMLMWQRDQNLIQQFNENMKQYVMKVAKVTPEELEEAERVAKQQMELALAQGTLYPNPYKDKEEDNAA